MSDLTKIPAPDEYGVRHPHKTVPLQVWVDVDEGIKPVVAYLNTVPGIRTLASCQGTLGEDGPEPYAPFQLESINYGVEKGWLTTKFQGPDVQSQVLVARMTPEGEQHFGLAASLKGEK